MLLLWLIRLLPMSIRLRSPWYSGNYRHWNIVACRRADFHSITDSFKYYFWSHRPVSNVKQITESVSIWQSTVSYFKEKVFSVGMVFAFVFVSIVSLVVSSFIALILKGFIAALSELINFAISLFIFSILFSAIYYFLPQRKIRFSVAKAAGILTALLFTIGKSLIGLFMGHSARRFLYMEPQAL